MTNTVLASTADTAMVPSIATIVPVLTKDKAPENEEATQVL